MESTWETPDDLGREEEEEIRESPANKDPKPREVSDADGEAWASKRSKSDQFSQERKSPSGQSSPSDQRSLSGQRSPGQWSDTELTGEAMHRDFSGDIVLRPDDDIDRENMYTPAFPVPREDEEEEEEDLRKPAFYREPSPSPSPPPYPSSKGSEEKIPLHDIHDKSTVDNDYKRHQMHSSIPLIGVSNRVAPSGQDDAPQPEMWQRQGKPSGFATGRGIEEDTRKKDFVIGAEDNTDGAGCCGWILMIFSCLLIIITLPFSLILCIKVVQEYERAVIFRLGRLPSGGAKGPGIFFIIPCIESYTKVDLRTVSFDVPPQEVLTKDSVTVSVDAVVYYRVSNPTVSVANVENAHHSTRLLAQTTLRNILGTKNMSEILSDRESISHGMQSTLDEATDRWGIRVERVEIKDVRLPVQLQRAMAAEAEAAREARAKVIAAEGEHKASRALRDAADVMASSNAALQLRYLQTLNSISAEKNSTIIFPLPIDMLKGFLNK